jgi:patatin-related protein
MSSPEPGDFPQREVRIGLVLYGGVALAVYINGVAQEMLRLVQASRGLERGEEVNAYAQLLRRANAKAMVDIISGTSAGGINGVALAKALCIGASMESLAQVWKQKAELGNLLNSPRRRDARSLLNEEYYQSVILDVLNDMDRTASDTPLVNALDLFISATDLHGEVLELKDFLEQDVKTRQYRKKFHLKFRTSNYNPVDRGLGYDRNDFHASRNLGSFNCWDIGAKSRHGSTEGRKPWPCFAGSL